MVGRDAEVDALDAVIAGVVGGAGRALLLSGEAGIGKSRLLGVARERFRQAAGPRALTLVGRCDEHDRMQPYAPLVDLLRHSRAQREDRQLADWVASEPALFARLLPELPAMSNLPNFDPEQEQRQLFEALAQWLLALSEQRPLLVAIEDVHWSDATSLEFLARLARGIAERPLLLVLTFRTDEMDANLRHLLARLDRERLATELALGRLPAADVERMVRAIFQQQQPIRPDFLRLLVELTDGNPFFIEEVLSALVASGEIARAGRVWVRRELADLRVPRSVADAVLRRCEALSAAALEVVRLAAVVGQHCNAGVLRALLGNPDDREFSGWLRELVAARLLEERSADELAFRHALTREAVYATLLVRDRRELQARTGAALERLYSQAGDVPAAVVADLAYHFHAGEVWDKALAYSRRAGLQALHMYAPWSAVEHLTRALEAAAQLSVLPLGSDYRARGQAWQLLGEFERARADYEQTLVCARRDGDRVAEWQGLIDLGELWAGYDYHAAGKYFEAALVVANGLEDERCSARSHLQIGYWLLNAERIDEADVSLCTALHLFEECADERGAAEAIDMLSAASDLSGDLVQMRRRAEQAAERYAALGDRRGQASALALLAIADGSIAVFDLVAVPPLVPPLDCEAAGQESLRIARDIGWRAGESYALINLGARAGLHGDLGRALDLSAQTLAIATELDHREWMTGAQTMHAYSYWQLLALPLARSHGETAVELAHATGALHWVNTTTGLLASILIDTGDLDAAAALLGGCSADMATRTLGQRWVWFSRARLLLAQGAPEQALEVIERLYATALHLRTHADIPILARLYGEVLAALGRLDMAETVLREAGVAAAERRLLPVLWRVNHSLGQTLRLTGRTTEASEAYGQARQVVGQIASTVADDVLRVEFLRQAAALLAGVSGDDTVTSAPPGVLTAREQDVIALLAQGLTNREIADALFIGARTVETHVANILGKLGVVSRAQAAAWAVEHGLARSAGPSTPAAPQ
jgi:DNA-binding CsgD family transcriptional regulator